MRFYVFLVLACVGIALGGKVLLDSVMSGNVHDAMGGTAMFFFSIVSLVIVGLNNRRRKRGKSPKSPGK